MGPDKDIESLGNQSKVFVLDGWCGRADDGWFTWHNDGVSDPQELRGTRCHSWEEKWVGGIKIAASYSE